MSKRIQVSRSSPYEPIIAFSRAVRIRDNVYVPGIGPVGCEDGVLAAQTDQYLTLIAKAS